MRIWFMSSCVALLMSGGPALGQVVVPPAEPAPVADSPAQPDPAPAMTLEEAKFAAWLEAYRPTALAAGVRVETVEANLAGLRFSPRVVELDRAQPDDSRINSYRFAEYLPRRLNNARIGQGRRLRSDLSATLSGIESKYGVQSEVLLGIWGMETSYGNDSGSFDLLRSLASLAYDGRRAELFTGELTAALQILDRGVIPRWKLLGSWAGATGQPQFLPSSWLNYSADGDGDGRADIWTSRPDVLASIGNYLAKHGWKAGQPWATQVYVPPGLDRERIRDLVKPSQCPRVMSKHSRWLTVKEWRGLGLAALGTSLPGDAMLATLVEPDGPAGGGYLTYGNYRAILRYNCSNFYALSVGLLADAVRGPDQPRAADGVRGDTQPEPAPDSEPVGPENRPTL